MRYAVGKDVEIFVGERWNICHPHNQKSCGARSAINPKNGPTADGVVYSGHRSTRTPIARSVRSARKGGRNERDRKGFASRF